MAEESTKKKGRLAAAILAGSALAFSSFAVGIPAALADEEATPAIATVTPEPEASSPAPSETPTAPGDETSVKDSADAETGDPEEEVEPTEPVTEEPTSPESSAESSPETESRFQTQRDDGDDGDGVNEDTFDITDVTMDINPGTLSDEEFRDNGVTLTIRELEPNQVVDVAIRNGDNLIDELSGPAEADGDGVATHSIQGDEDLVDIYVGDYSVVVTESGSEVQLAEGSFEVTSETPRVSALAKNPTDDGAVRQGEVLDVKGYNATPDDVVTIDYGIGGVSEEELETDEDGRFDTEFRVPEDATLGIKTLTLTDGDVEVTTQYTVAEAEAEVEVESPEIKIEDPVVYQGGELEVTVSNLTANGEVEVHWNPTATVRANPEGVLQETLPIADDAETGVQTLAVTDVSTGAAASAEYTVLEAVDPALTIDPERIELDDFIGDPEDGAGVAHTVQGMEPGTEISYAVTGPEYVSDFESTAPVQEDGVASFVIYGYDVANPSVYLGEYNTVVTYIDEDGETQTLSGTFTVVDADDSTGGTGGSDDDRGSTGPVDLNGASGLAQTGANGIQLGMLAGGLLLAGGALLAFANRQRLFGRTA